MARGGKRELGSGEKGGNARYLHIHEKDGLDDEQLASWIRQASEIPGWLA